MSWNEVGKIDTKTKAPKNNRGLGYTNGQQYCKGLCTKFEKTRPYRKPYETHALCGRCMGTGISTYGCWMELAILVPSPKKGLVCPCCNFRPKQKPSKKTPYLPVE